MPRAGTTSLHAMLSGHPDVFMPSVRKEIRFFDLHFDRGVDWYQAFFSSPEAAHSYAVIGEISPQYISTGEECPDRISQTLPGVKLILMLRHPVDRAYSHYGFVVQRCNYRGSFEEFLATAPCARERLLLSVCEPLFGTLREERHPPAGVRRCRSSPIRCSTTTGVLPGRGRRRFPIISGQS